MNQNKKRKLSAILFADIVNYSAVMQRDEQQASSFLKKFRDALSTHTEQYDGQIIQFYGDGCLCVFASSVHAAGCALALQTTFLSNPSVPVRIGVHSGDVFFEAENVYGDSVNITSRIESLGSAGAVLISERVAKDLGNHPDFEISYVGSSFIKNIEGLQKIFALSNEGLVVPSSLSAPKELRQKTPNQPFNRKTVGWSAAILTLLALIIYLGYDKLISSNLSQDSTVAVLSFENNTGDDSFHIVSDMVTDRIVHGITQNELASVITSETIEEFGKMVVASPKASDPITLMRSQFGVTEVIKGHIYIDQDDLVFECTISDAKSKKVVKGLEAVRTPKNDPMYGIEKIRQLVLGFLASRQDRASDLLLETHVPKLEAYRALELAKATDNEELELQYLNQAIELDSNYFEPKVLRLSWYYNAGEFKLMDSLRKKIMSDPLQSDKRQQNLLNFYDALLDGKNDLVYQFMNREYMIAPFHLETNTTMIVLAMQFIYQIKEAIDIYQVIEDQNLDFANCSTCRVRLYLKAYIDMEMGQYPKAMEVSQLLNKYSSDVMSTEVLIKSYAGAKQWTELSDLISNHDGAKSAASLAELYLDAAKACLLSGNAEWAAKFAAKANNIIGPETDLFAAAEIQLIMDEPTTSTQFLERLIKTDSTHLEAMGYLAGTALREGNAEIADQYIQKLNQLRKPYQFGEIDYHIAQAFAIGNDHKRAISYLEKSVAQGQRFNFGHFHHDFIFHTIRKEDAFEKVLQYWH